jgi:hypothetical protein
MPYVTPGTPGVAVTPAKVIYEELRIKTIDAGYARPGAIVKRDTDDSHVQVAGSGDTGLIGFIAPDPAKDVTTDFSAEDHVRIGHGAGAVVALPFDHTAGSVTKGDPLYCGLHGKVVKGSTDVTKLVAWAEESKSASGLLRARLAK